jgi:PAS domain S-box-containing protein
MTVPRLSASPAEAASADSALAAPGSDESAGASRGRPEAGRWRLARVPRRIAWLYAAAGTAWIVGSGSLLRALVTDPALAAKLEIAQGLGFIAITAALLYLLLRRELRDWDREAAARRQSEAELRASQEHFQLASRVGRIGTFEHDYATGLTLASPVLQDLDELGSGPNRFAALLERMLPEDRAEFLAAQRRAEDPAGEGRFECEYRQRYANGRVRWMLVQAQVWFHGEGAGRRPARRVGTVMDITERKDTEATYRVNETRYRSLFANAMNGLSHCQIEFTAGKATDFTYLAVNKAFHTMTGLKNVIGKRITEIFPQIRETDPGLLELFGQVAQTGEGQRVEIYITALQQWQALSVYRPTEGQVVAVFDVITARKRAEEELRTLTRAIDQSPTSIVITDAAGAIQYVNPRFTEVSGYAANEVRGKNPRFLKSGQNPPEHYHDLWATITAGRVWHGELCNRKKNGELFWERVSISPVLDVKGSIANFVAVKEDVTEQRRLQEHLQHAQRMESVGALASGIAHDLNNILAPVLMASALLKTAGRSEQEQTMLEIIEQSAIRGSNVVKQLLAFSRSGGGKRHPLEIQELIREMRGILAETFPREITLRFEVGPDLQPVLGDATQLHQVLLNLCVNARDAMPGGGLLAVGARNFLIDPEWARLNPPAKPGAHVLLTVADTGMGMTPELIERIFDPFFTTKEVGKGTGLGLSTSLGIVRGHGGFFKVESEPGRGTTFAVYLPAAPAEDAGPSVVRAAEPPRGRNELILIVDDEANVGRSMRGVLEEHGYRVVVATASTEGLAVFRSRAAEISLVLSDLMMPVMNGAAMLREMRRIRGDFKACVMTGLASASKQAELAAIGVSAVLAKPCDRRELLLAVRGALDDPGTGPAITSSPIPAPAKAS